MSSDYTIHLWDKSIKGQVDHFPDLPFTTVCLTVEDKDEEPGNRERFTLFLHRNQLPGAVLLFHKIAQDLAALLPDTEAGADWRTHRHCLGDPLGLQHGPNLHTHDAAGNVDTIMGLPYVAGAVDTLDGDSIPIDDVREAVEPPHRWG